MKLSIAIITWNRANQLIEALTSCTFCRLPESTEFIIIDNASVDDTEEKVKFFFSDKKYSIYYEKMKENVGAGMGRNYAFSKASGDYVYFLDDDAYLDINKSVNFFIKAIDILDTYGDVMTLTTQIYDLMWKSNRVSENGPIIYGSLKKCFMVCGGSHFLRRSFFKDEEPYFSNRYGYEELKPSLLVSDAGFLNAFTSELTVIHNPIINKWDYNDEKNKEILVRYVVNQFVLKSNIYPLIYYPLCYGVYVYRKHRYLKDISVAEIDRMIDELQATYSLNRKLKIKTIYRLYKDFGISIF